MFPTLPESSSGANANTTTTKKVVSRQTMKSPSEAAAKRSAVVVAPTRPKVAASVVKYPPLPDPSPVRPCIPQLGSDPAVEAEIAQAARHFAARRQIGDPHPLTPEERQRIERALNGGLPTNTSEVTDILSLIFRLTSQEDLPELQRKALLDIADRLPALFEAYSVATNIQSAAQKSLDRLNDLKAEENKLIADYDEQVALRQTALSEAEKCRLQIGEIDASLTQLEMKYEDLRASCAGLEHRLKQIAAEKSRLIQSFKPNVRLIQEAKHDYELAIFDKKHNQDAMKEAAALWENYRRRIVDFVG